MNEKPDTHLDVVFVHGLGSSSDKAWVNDATNFNWPEAMDQQPHLAAIAVDYSAPIRNAMDAGAVKASWQDSGLGLLNYLANRGIGKRPVVFVAHSLGGIVVKHALRAASESGNAIYKNTRGVFFLATPHAGASIANIAGKLGQLVPNVGNLVAKAAGAAGGVAVLAWGVSWLAGRQLETSQITNQLRELEPALLDLNRWYRTARHIETHAYYETELTYAVQVVDPASADPGATGCSVLSATGKNHITICKPANNQDEIFVTVKRIVESIRSRVRSGRSYPVMREGIRERLIDSDFPQYADMDNFEDVPTSVRRKVELELREGFRKIFKESPPDVATQRLLGESTFNVDRFALSLWLEEVAGEQLEGLILYIRKAAAKVEVARGEDDQQPASLIPLFRAARTLDHFLCERPYDMYQKVLAEALKIVNREHDRDASVDGDNKTREVLTRLLTLAEGFAKAKANALALAE